MTLLFLTACLPEMVSTLTASITNTSEVPIADARVLIRDQYGMEYGRVTADANGYFTADLPAYASFFLIISADNYETSSFAGYSGEGDNSAPNGTLFLRTETEITANNAEFDGCSVGDPQLDGEIRMYIPGQEYSDMPLVTSATVAVYDANEVATDGCYLPTTDEETDEVSSIQTGETGRFLVPNLDQGLHRMEVTVDYGDGTDETFPYYVYVPSEGNVPLYPTLVTILDQ